MVIPKRTTLSLGKILVCPILHFYWKQFCPPNTIHLKFEGLAFNELTLNQFKTIVILCSKQFSTTERLELDLHKILLSLKLQMSVFKIIIMRLNILNIKILNMRGPRIEP